MGILQRIFDRLRESVFGTAIGMSRFEVQIDVTGGSQYSYGDRSGSGEAIFMPGGPRNDPTKIWEGPFPPVGHSEAEPIIGAPATEMSAPVLRAATVTAVEEGAQKVTARVEYRKRPVVFTRRFDGSYRSAGAPDDYATRLFIGVRASNLKTYKLWWSEGDLSVGPIVD